MMKKLILLIALGQWLVAQPPTDWTVNPSNYESAMTITGILYINGSESGDTLNTIAAFQNDTCRGVINPIYTLDQWMYFLMVYGNTNYEDITFLVYDSGRDTILNITDTLSFITDDQYGQPDDPFIFHAIDSTTLNLPPIITSIEDLEINEDTPTNIQVVYSDPNNDQLTLFSHSSDPNILTTIVDYTLSISTTENWNGSGTITVVVSDSEYSDSTSFVLTVNPVNDAPEDFGLLEPLENVTINITNDNLNDTFRFMWEIADDVDGDQVDYIFHTTGDLDILGVDQQDFNEIIWTHGDVVSLMNAEGVTNITGTWNISATDGIASTTSTDGPFTLTIDASTVALVHDPILPSKFALHQNYPNPFNPTTSIEFSLPHKSSVELNVYDVKGQLVNTLVKQFMEGGNYKVIWSGKDMLGRDVSAGLYIIRLNTGDYTESRKAMFLK